jgi:hypothetical protein
MYILNLLLYRMFKMLCILGLGMSSLDACAIIFKLKLALVGYLSQNGKA